MIRITLTTILLLLALTGTGQAYEIFSDPSMHFGAGYAWGLTAKTYGWSERDTRIVGITLAVAKECIDENRHNSNPRAYDGWNTAELVAGILGEELGMKMWDWGVSVNKNILLFRKTW
jgi:hypothetical protein